MKNRTTLTAGAVIIVTMMVLSILLVWQRNTNTRLRKELERLRVERVQSDRLTEENERLREENQGLTGVKIDGDEMERLRRENGELLRLRGQLSTAKRVLGDKDRQLEDAQSQLNESLQRAAKLGETNAVLTAMEAAALRHLSVAAKSKMLKEAMAGLWDVAETNETGLNMTLAQVAPERRALLQFLTTPEEGFAIVYQGRLNDLQRPGETIVVRQREAEEWPDGMYSRVYGFGDGHVEIHKTPDGNFEDWERERMVP